MRKEELQIYQRRLPHWRIDGSVYFVTWRLQPFQYELNAQERTIIENAIGHFDGERYELLAYVVMHDHVHLIVEPEENYRLQQLVHSWKSFSTNQLQRQFNRKRSV